MKTRSNMPLYVVACTNIKQLTNEQINMLRCGDWIVKKTGNQEHAYKVTFKSPTGICLTYMDASVIETQSYDYVDGEWVYNSEDKTPNLLDVPINTKVVHKITAPTSTTLTDEEIEIITRGVFIEGTFLGDKNPVLFPANYFSDRYYQGVYIGGTNNANTIGCYLIDMNDKSISITPYRYNKLNSVLQINGKEWPTYPANTGTFVLKSLDGVLTWVAE